MIYVFTQPINDVYKCKYRVAINEVVEHEYCMKRTFPISMLLLMIIEVICLHERSHKKKSHDFFMLHGKLLNES